jgi:hypothetical protein
MTRRTIDEEREQWEWDAQKACGAPSRRPAEAAAVPAVVDERQVMPLPHGE